jgi:hypothetical protein
LIRTLKSFAKEYLKKLSEKESRESIYFKFCVVFYRKYTYNLYKRAFIIGFLVGAKQEQKRLKPKEYVPEPEVVEKLQTLAGIKEHDVQKGVEILMNAPGSERFVELLKQNRADIESNEAASIQLTGESDSHYYYKQSKDTKKSDNNKK